MAAEIGSELRHAVANLVMWMHHEEHCEFLLNQFWREIGEPVRRCNCGLDDAMRKVRKIVDELESD